ncbi:MAG TPA: TetR/AcrR family transcriptional regulator [Dinghuibacter sp.]|uniref:TetR/AcrR family transcriptional regulator n=1 Tax=Dinghuibacter sp. TaxID=2024697 RepID=UPI002CBE2F13|nr:TetR/AcrR family transcriptional regulator [Dinghuibacter sp.]HTJ12958.1 TetR/AcrR family transcriptional regulator [Dinghuibacter sp.]
MGTLERKQRLKEEVRCRILEASWQIVKEEGWHALSMRKIADAIEYTAPIIYGYFENKEAILKELTTQGFRILSCKVKEARGRHDDPAEQLEAMWMAYWDFAFEHQAYYQLMYGVDVDCCQLEAEIRDAEHTVELLDESLAALIAQSKNPHEDPCRRFYTFWAVVHGLISLNIIRKGTLSLEVNRSILKDALRAIITDIRGGC